MFVHCVLLHGTAQHAAGVVHPEQTGSPGCGPEHPFDVLVEPPVVVPPVVAPLPVVAEPLEQVVAQAEFAQE